MLPVEGVADAVIEIVPPLARKAGHFPQDPKWQMGLQVEAIQASHRGVGIDAEDWLGAVPSTSALIRAGNT